MSHVDKAENFLENESNHFLDENFKFELINEKHSDDIIKWRNNSSISSLMFNKKKLDKTTQNQFLNNYKNLDRIDFILIHSPNNKAIGSFSISNISSSTPEIGKLLGEESFRGKGIAYKSTKALLYFSFNYLKIEKIFAKTLKNNSINLHLNKKLGFEIIKEEEIDGKPFIVMEIKKSVDN